MIGQQRESSYLRDMEQDLSPNLIPVHVSQEEKAYFDYMQGGETIDESTGLPSYPGLSEVFRNPEVRDLFADLTHVMKTGGDLPPEINEFVNEEDPYKDGIPNNIPEQEFNPFVRNMAQAGEQDNPSDNLIVMLPEDVAQFLDEIQGDEDRDPEYGLREFGFFDKGFGNVFKSIVRVGATIAGAALGGPIGGGLGNMLGRAVTGQKPGSDMLMAGLQNGLYTGAAGAGLNALNSFGGFGAGAAGAAGTGAAGTAGAVGATGRPLYMGAGTVGQTSHLVTPTSGGGLGSSLGGLFSGGGLGGGLFGGGGGGFMSSLFPMAMQMGGAMMSQKGKEDDLKTYNQLRAEQQDRMRKQLAPMNEHLNQPMNYQQPFINTSGSTINAYKKGGTIVSESYQGADKGQDDTLKKTCKEGDFIWTATDVGHLGDGNTKAGFKEIKRWENSWKRGLPKSLFKDPGLKHGGKPRDVKCLLSDGEHRTDVKVVSHIGEGDNDEGSKILRAMREELRREKISNGTGLPPKAKSLDYYYRKAVSKK